MATSVRAAAGRRWRESPGVCFRAGRLDLGKPAERLQQAQCERPGRVGVEEPTADGWAEAGVVAVGEGLVASLGCLSLSVTEAIGGAVTDDAGCWVVEFYGFTTAADQLDGDLAQLGDVHERARRNGARQGTPVIVHTAGEADARVNLFFRTGPMAAARPATWRRYAQGLPARRGTDLVGLPDPPAGGLPNQL